PGDAGLPNADGDRVDGELRGQRVGRRRREGLEEPVRPLPGDAPDEVAYRPVVHGRLDRVLRRLGHVERDVEEERLRRVALGRVDAVRRRPLEPADLDDHAIALATDSASTCSLTSCARRIVAPRSYAATAAAREAESGPVRASGSPRSRPRELLREKPI